MAPIVKPFGKAGDDYERRIEKSAQLLAAMGYGQQSTRQQPTAAQHSSPSGAQIMRPGYDKPLSSVERIAREWNRVYAQPTPAPEPPEGMPARADDATAETLTATTGEAQADLTTVSTPKGQPVPTVSETPERMPHISRKELREAQLRAYIRQM